MFGEIRDRLEMQNPTIENLQWGQSPQVLNTQQQQNELSRMTLVMMNKEMFYAVNTNLQEMVMEDLHIEVNGKVKAMEGILGEMATLEI